MKKIIAIVIWLYFFIFILAANVSAFNFVKSDQPLSINLKDDYAYILQSHIYMDLGKCKGVLSAKKSTQNYFSLIAIESDNCSNWQMTKEVLTRGEDLSNPKLFIDDDGSRRLFFEKMDDRDFYRIYSTVCDENLNCSSNIRLEINPDRNNFSEKNGYTAPNVIKIGTTYYLFYGAWGVDGFKIRLAYSNDLQNWQKCQNNMIAYGYDAPFAYLKNNDLYLFYHQINGQGIKLSKTSLPLSCNSQFEDLGFLLTRTESYDSKHMISPSVVNTPLGLKLFYSGANSSWVWSLNAALEKKQILIIPGFMASWNKSAILHNQTVSQSDWKINPFVKEYQGLINTLKNLGYEENNNLFIFNYDWRKSILEIVEDLNNFITNHQSLTTNHYFIVGHSLGGLVGRIYQQKYKDINLSKLITVGSPHKGVVQVYKPLMYGKIDRVNTFLWLAEKIILFLNKSTIESDKETISKKFPVLFDILPIFNFLKDENGQEISYDILEIKNNLLIDYNLNFNEIFNLFTAIYGEKDNNTLAGYIVDKNDILKIKNPFFDLGDYLVLKKSADQDEDSQKFVFDHGEIIYKKEAISKILQLLEIDLDYSQISEGEKTKISKSLIFLIRSPAKMSVKYNEKEYQEDDGMIMITDAESGEYEINVQGIEKGSYELIIGQISENNDLWEKIEGKITKDPPQSQIDIYRINYDNQNAVSIYPTPTLILTSTPTLILTLTPTPTLTSTTTSILTSSSIENQTVKSSSNQSSQLTSSSTSLSGISSQPNQSVLGVSSVEKEVSISPTKKIIKDEKVDKKTEIINLKNYILTFIFSLLIGISSYFFKKKFFNK